MNIGEKTSLTAISRKFNMAANRVFPCVAAVFVVASFCAVIADAPGLAFALMCGGAASAIAALGSAVVADTIDKRTESDLDGGSP